LVYSHKNQNNELEELSTHLEEVAKMCSYFADSFDSSDWGKLIGELHDLGKNTEAFQHRLLNNGPKVDHSTIGAQIALKYKYIPAYCIAGHHTGLMNGGSSADTAADSTLQGRLKRECYPLLSHDFFQENDDRIIRNPKIEKVVPQNLTISAATFIRILYSCLVDADYLCTEKFMNPLIQRNTFLHFDFGICVDKMDKNYKSLSNSHNELNLLRNKIVIECKHKAYGPEGIYTLWVPTGTGKTLASMYFALNHLIKWGKRRIIYVIPYTSIIEQNAKVFKSLFGNIVLEHHSNVQFKEDDDESCQLQLATENWDMPIIVTTNVQFFNSFFANKSSKLRKLHNIANSVLIFDEVQMIPNDYLEPCLYTISELVKNYHCSSLFCSATQPPFAPFFHQYSTNLNPIIPDNQHIFEQLKRVIYRYEGILSLATLAKKLIQEKQVLCIVNSKKIAKDIFILVKDLTDNNVYYLTTNLCPIHRTKRINKIKQNLYNNKSCLVIATSLVEAGVDLDFPQLFRQISGVDSIVQAAGRCNREGKRLRQNSIVSIFECEEIYNKSIPQSIRQKAYITKNIIDNHGCNFDNLDLVDDYYKSLYALNGPNGFDRSNIMSMHNCAISSIPFQDIAQKFALIDNNDYTIIIPFDDYAKTQLESIYQGIITKQIIRNLNPYTVNISVWQYKILQDQGAIEIFDKGIIVLVDETKYKQETGLSIDVKDTGNAIFDC